jgi:hypothetical protein
MKSPEVQAPSPASIVVSSPAENITPRQYNTLVILVDDISASAKKNPQNVKGVWLTAYLPSQTKLMLMPLYTIEDINTETIQNQFRLGGKGAPSREFFKAVRKFDVTWDYYVLIETVIFEELFDRANAENIEWNGHPELLWSVTHQAMLANEICKLAGDFTQSTDRRPIYDGFEGYYITDFDTERLLELWKQNQGLGSRLTCEFPTLRDVLPITHAAH